MLNFGYFKVRPSTQPNRPGHNPVTRHRAAYSPAGSVVCCRVVRGTRTGEGPLHNLTDLHTTLQHTTEPQGCVQLGGVLQGCMQVGKVV